MNSVPLSEDKTAEQWIVKYDYFPIGNTGDYDYQLWMEKDGRTLFATDGDDWEQEELQEIADTLNAKDGLVQVTDEDDENKTTVLKDLEQRVAKYGYAHALETAADDIVALKFELEQAEAKEDNIPEPDRIAELEQTLLDYKEANAVLADDNIRVYKEWQTMESRLKAANEYLERNGMMTF